MFRLKLAAVSMLAAALVLGSLVAVSESQAGKKKSPFAAQITALQETNALLAKADHDYQGHRVKAMRYIHQAVHALKYGSKKQKNPFKGPKGTGGIPQDQSDKMLSQAQDQVNAVLTQLGSVQDPRAAVAVTALQAAVKELTIALKIK
jgi:hypothetical protein